MTTTKNYSCIASTYSAYDRENPQNAIVDKAREAVVKGRCTDEAVIGALDELESYWEEENDNGSVGSVERMRAAEQAVCHAYVDARVREAMGQYAASRNNPTGGCGYYDADESNPFRVCFSDSAGCESYSTLSAAIDEARTWAEGEAANAESDEA